LGQGNKAVPQSADITFEIGKRLGYLVGTVNKKFKLLCQRQGAG
jgi:hypothetical protein